MNKLIEELIEDLWGERHLLWILIWPGKPYHEYGETPDTAREVGMILEFEHGMKRYHNDLTPSTHRKLLEIDKLVESANDLECLTSKYGYVREYKKWLIDRRVEI